MKRLGKVLLGVLLTLLWLWTLGASRYVAGGTGWFALGAYLVASAVVVFRWRKAAWAFVLVTWLLALAWFLTLSPRNDRDWVDDQARTPTAELSGTSFTIRDVRCFRYRSLEDYDVRYEDRTYDLGELTGVDLVMCHWGGLRAVGHTMLSFEFAGKDHLVLSVEARKEKGETYGVVSGMYRQFEVLYVLADERDALNVRTSFRGEDVYLYRLAGALEDGRRYLGRVLERVNELAEEPEFYDTLDYNCTSALTRMSEELWPERVRQGGIRSLLNGYAAEDAYRRGLIRSDLPFEELRERSRVTPVGREHRDDPDFSRLIREKLPR